MSKRRLYLNNEIWEQALKQFENALKEIHFFESLQTENLDVYEALGRITAEPVFAQMSSPHYPASAMDGIAVKAEETYGATESNPKVLFLGQGAVEVDTGDPLPQGYNAVIMAEDLHYIDEEQIEIIGAASPWQHVRSIGEDITLKELILPVNHQIRPYDIGGCLAGGVSQVSVYAKPKVGIIPTGTELVELGKDLKPGDIVEYNSRVLGSLVKEWDAEPVLFPIVPDDYDLLEKILQEATKTCDLIVINAGSSAGREDFTHAVIENNGKLLVHGLAIKPGKPGMLGIVNQKPIIGVPGYPVSAVLVFELLAKPIVYGMMRRQPKDKEKLQVTLSKKLAKPMGIEEFVRVNIGKVGEKYVAVPISRGAGVISSMIKADGILRMPRLTEGYQASTQLEIELIKSKQEIDHTVVCVGSHDLTLDHVANTLKSMYPEQKLISANVGSLGGIMALKKGECHFAGMHLLDESTGEYNISFVERYLGQENLILVNLVYRQQGLMVPKQNPKGIQSLEDVIEQGLLFVNRQPGSGTRILLDYLLKEKGLAKEKLIGYNREEFTHLAVAAQIEAGNGDVGLGIASAAESFDLDFIPIIEERYDLCLKADFLTSNLFEPLKHAIMSESLQAKVQSLQGYDLRDCGKVIWSNCGIKSW
jgi:putative molybdopterin biosynthesis protein